MNELLGATEPRNIEKPVRLPKELPEGRLLQALRPGELDPAAHQC